MGLIVTLGYFYAGFGAATALAFVLVGVNRIDAAAHGAWLARLMWLPGLMLLWPVVLLRWIALERQRGRAE